MLSSMTDRVREFAKKLLKWNASANDEFTPEQLQKLAYLCKLRGETPQQVLGRFGLDGVRRCPSLSRQMSALLEATFADAGLREGVPYVVAPNGRIFYGHHSAPSHRAAYEYFKDMLSPKLSPDTFIVGLDVAQRYFADYPWYEWVPGKGGVIVEAGAYLGHKSIAWIDKFVGLEGKVLAIEMMPDNASLLRRNVHENNLESNITVREAGVWNSRGTTRVKGVGRQRNSLVSIEHIDRATEHVVPTLPLDELLADWGQPKVDLLYMTVNGAEYEALEGLDRALNMVHHLVVVARYERDGNSSYSRCRDLLVRKGCRIVSAPEKGHLVAVSPCWC